MGIIDIIIAFFSRSPVQVIFDLFALGGYLLFVWLLLYAAIKLYIEYRQNKYTADWKWVVLAIDMPALNIQTPKAVEQMFAHLAGAFNQPDIAGKFHEGFVQRYFSFEIISIGGYIQFLVRTEETFRELVEAAMYAQYPEATITEVEDYVTDIPDTYPNDTHDIRGCDFALAENDAYPIRSYREFEHNISKDTVLKDPMGTFLESFSRIGPGEQMWFQIIVLPISNAWKEKAIKKIKEVIGEKAAAKNTWLDPLINAPFKVLEGVGDQIFGREGEVTSGKTEKPEEKNQLRYLTPGQVKVVEEMEKKISMIGLRTKMRGIYLGRKEVFRPERGFNAMVGAINQFNIPTANSIVPKFTLDISYFHKQKRIAKRKGLLMKAYKKRKMGLGASPFVLNVEELATVWHFPMSHVKTPLLQKAQAKQAEPPAELPVEQISIEDQIRERTGGVEEGQSVKKEYQIDAYGYPDDMKFG